MPRRALCESLGSPERLISHGLAEAAKAAPSPAVAAKAAIATRSVPAASSPATVAIAAIASPAVLAPTAEQAAGLAEFSQAYVRRSNASREQRSRYGSYLADSRAVAGFRPETKGMLYPIVGARAQGSEMFDVDGNRDRKSTRLNSSH